MLLRPFLISSLCAVAALTSACDGDQSVRISSTTTVDNDAKGVLKVVQALQCPQTLGSLTRKGTATAGGTVCTYVGPKGAEVILHLVPLNGGSPPQVLKAFEERLSSSLPRALEQLRASAEQAAADQERATAEADRAVAEADRAAADADRAAANADRAIARATASGGDTASVRAPGVAIDANDEDASVRLPGISIDAKGDNASVRIGGFHIDANDNTGSVDIQGGSGGDNVSVRAQNDSSEVRAVSGGEATRASWILTDNRPSADGWRLVGYEARGPVGGPLVVATVRSRDRNRGRVFDDARELVTLNVGE
jgi:hypothetical protein